MAAFTAAMLTKQALEKAAIREMEKAGRKEVGPSRILENRLSPWPEREAALQQNRRDAEPAHQGPERTGAKHFLICI